MRRPHPGRLALLPCIECARLREQLARAAAIADTTRAYVAAIRYGSKAVREWAALVAAVEKGAQYG